MHFYSDSSTRDNGVCELVYLTVSGLGLLSFFWSTVDDDMRRLFFSVGLDGIWES